MKLYNGISNDIAHIKAWFKKTKWKLTHGSDFVTRLYLGFIYGIVISFTIYFVGVK